MYERDKSGMLQQFGVAKETTRIRKIIPMENLFAKLTNDKIKDHHENNIGLSDGFIQPKLNERKRTPAIINNMPKTDPLDLGE